MTTVFVLTLVTFLLVIASLAGGLISMVHGGEADYKHATHFMFARIGFQALAVVLLLLLVYMLYE